MPLIAPDRIDRTPAPKRRQLGLTLVELTVTLLILTVLATIAIRSTNDLGFQVRYEQTKERLEMIRHAILGNPRLIINGQQAISGFVADMGRLPTCLRELVDNYNCDTGLENTTWVNVGVPSNLSVGWRGPYLNISGNPEDKDAFTDGWGREAKGYCETSIYTDQSACDVSDWIGVANDHNYGWYFNQLPLEENTLTILSYGKDQVYSGSSPDYDADYPANRPVIRSTDWLVDISGGISASFVKTTKALPISYCSDSSKTTKATCVALETWYGLCDKAGFYNADSCSDEGGNWGYCSNGTSATQSECTTASGTWLYCFDGASPNQAACFATKPPGIWAEKGYGCSDQIYVAEDTCESNSKTWYGCADGGDVNRASCTTAWFVSTNETSILPTIKTPICMKVFYRRSDSTIGVLVSDGDISNDTDGDVKFDPNIIIADGSIQVVRFTNFRDLGSSIAAPLSPLGIPVGSNAIGIYQYDGASCETSNLPYPNDLYNPIQVDFRPNTTLPVINW